MQPQAKVLPASLRAGEQTPMVAYVGVGGGRVYQGVATPTASSMPTPSPSPTASPTAMVLPKKGVSASWLYGLLLVPGVVLFAIIILLFRTKH
jgi:hypothetical protein